ncbi:MAG: His-Xaa-Ser system radical SAM maturase HxsB [Parcubacteria group bacterium]|jgi:His-Xaa-Ser system radical SAM maturase HxsB
MDFNTNKLNHSKVGFFRYKKLGKEYLLTNDVGDYALLEEKEFKQYLEGKINPKNKKYRELLKKNFIRDKINFETYIEKYAKKRGNLLGGPSLHIIVVTLRCNYNCIYCQTSSKKVDDMKYDMDLATAKQTVDFIFTTPNKNIAIEFQGGEPLLNWPIVKFIVEYANEKNKAEKKNLELRLVSNFSLMDKEKLEFFFNNHVALCSSLDGPKEIQNKNRPFLAQGSYESTTKWLNIALEKYRQLERKKVKGKIYYHQPGAIVTVSRFSLDHPKEIVDEYLKWGFEAIFLRPLSPLGIAGKIWSKIGYTTEEYLKFYQKALEYIFELNKSGKKFHERTAAMMASKILEDEDINYLELRSPCGAGIGQLAYDYDGSIYTCDEGRMMGYAGEDMFKLGDVTKNSYSEIIDNPTLKGMCLASETSCQAGCAHCAYQPYCGVCPIYNYAETGNIFSQQPNSMRCIISKSIFDMIFEYLQSNKTKKILERWARREIECSQKIPPK